MADIIQIEQVRHKNDNISAGTDLKTNGPCQSPIVIKRLNEIGVSIAFHRHYFDIPFIENALQGLAYGQAWDLFRPKEEPSPVYSTYIIILRRDYGKETDDMLTTAVDRITKRAYMEEIRLWDREINISDLVKPHQYKLEDGANISAKTKAALLLSGMKTAWDLAHLTREELCQLPGMTTEEIVKLEKSLASRGVYLKTEIPS